MIILNEKEKLLKNPLTILNSEAVFLALKKLWINNHVNVKDPAKMVGDLFVFLESLKSETEVNPQKIRDYYGQLLKENTLGEINQDFKQDMLVQLIEEDLAQAETILDFGCGKLAFLKNIAEQNNNIKSLIGMDPQSQPVLVDLDPRISFERNLENISEASVDLAIIKLVLHHVEGDEAIMEILKNIKKVLKAGGKLIIFEESYFCHSERNESAKRLNAVEESNSESKLDPATSSAADYAQDDICNVKKYLQEFDLELAEEATSDFLRLTQEEKKQFLFLNDWLMNLQNKYMPWSGEYKSMEEWTELTEEAGFKNLENHFIGAIAKRKRKQGMTVILNFFRKEKKPSV